MIKLNRTYTNEALIASLIGLFDDFDERDKSVKNNNFTFFFFFFSPFFD